MDLNVIICCKTGQIGCIMWSRVLQRNEFCFCKVFFYFFSPVGSLEHLCHSNSISTHDKGLNFAWRLNLDTKRCLVMRRQRNRHSYDMDVPSTSTAAKGFNCFYLFFFTIHLFFNEKTFSLTISLYSAK